MAVLTSVGGSPDFHTLPVTVGDDFDLFYGLTVGGGSLGALFTPVRALYAVDVGYEASDPEAFANGMSALLIPAINAWDGVSTGFTALANTGPYIAPIFLDSTFPNSTAMYAGAEGDIKAVVRNLTSYLTNSALTFDYYYVPEGETTLFYEQWQIDPTTHLATQTIAPIDFTTSLADNFPSFKATYEGFFPGLDLGSTPCGFVYCTLFADPGDQSATEGGTNQVDAFGDPVNAALLDNAGVFVEAFMPGTTAPGSTGTGTIRFQGFCQMMNQDTSVGREIILFTIPGGSFSGAAEDPEDPELGPAPVELDVDVTPPPTLLPTETQLAGYTQYPDLAPEYAFLNRSSDITKVLNGFFTAMESWLVLFPDREGYTQMQTEIDMDVQRITGLADGVAPHDLVTLAQVEALV